MSSRRRLYSEPDSDRVGSLEANPSDVPGQPIRVFGHDLNGIGAVSLEDPNRACRADPVAVQKHHDLANDLLFFPSYGDAPCA